MISQVDVKPGICFQGKISQKIQKEILGDRQIAPSHHSGAVGTLDWADNRENQAVLHRDKRILHQPDPQILVVVKGILKKIFLTESVNIPCRAGCRCVGNLKVAPSLVWADNDPGQVFMGIGIMVFFFKPVVGI